MEDFAPVMLHLSKFKSKQNEGLVEIVDAEDDKKVADLVGIHGTHKWSFIGSRRKRNGKQCRERWHNQLDPSINQVSWSVVEDVKEY